VFWLEGREPALHRLAAAFDPERTDAALLLQRTVTAVGYEGRGRLFDRSVGKTATAAGSARGAPFLFAGIQLLHRRAFAGISERVFSSVRLFDHAEETGRLQVIVHDGEWYHIGTPQGLAATRERLASHRIER